MSWISFLKPLGRGGCRCCCASGQQAGGTPTEAAVTAPATKRSLTPAPTAELL
jgi:hypothetical protein